MSDDVREEDGAAEEGAAPEGAPAVAEGTGDSLGEAKWAAMKALEAA